jgi:hypothetical protein
MRMIKEIVFFIINFFIRAITYWRDLWIELKTFFIFYNVANENREALWENASLRVDWIGRIYGIVNLPEELLTHEYVEQESYVMQSLAHHSKILAQIGLIDVSFPEIQKVTPQSFLVIHWPSYSALNFLSLLSNILRLGVIILIADIAYNAIMKHSDLLINTGEKLYNIIINYL